MVRLLTRRLGPLSGQKRTAIQKLPLTRIETLGEALLDFESPADLERWLKNKQPTVPH